VPNKNHTKSYIICQTYPNMDNCIYTLLSVIKPNFLAPKKLKSQGNLNPG